MGLKSFFNLNDSKFLLLALNHLKIVTSKTYNKIWKILNIKFNTNLYCVSLLCPFVLSIIYYYLIVLLGRSPKFFSTTRLFQLMNAPPPSSIAPCPTSQLSRCPDTNTTLSGSVEPLISAIVFRDVALAKNFESIFKKISNLEPKWHTEKNIRFPLL